MMKSDEQRLVQMFRALGNPVRFFIVTLLAEKHVCITGEIVASTMLAQSTVSAHLKILREASVISSEMNGTATCYCLNVDGMSWLKDQIENWLTDCC
jgi:ArsR family transcriptional regulator